MKRVKFHSLIKAKIKSQKGASITFALLLFLVCAVISSVVIVAGTAAGGRLKNIPESDQRYYAVTSASELLKNAIDGKTVVAVKARKEVIKHKYNSNGVENTPISSSPDVAYDPTEYYTDLSEIEDSTKNKQSNYSMLTGIVCDLVNENRLNQNPVSPPIHKTFSLTATAGSLELKNEKSGSKEYVVEKEKDKALEAVSVILNEQIDQNGRITFYVSKEVDEDTYSLKLVFEGEKTEKQYIHTDYGSPVPDLTNSDVAYTIVETKEIREATIFKWHLVNIVKSTVPTNLFPTPALSAEESETPPASAGD